LWPECVDKILRIHPRSDIVDFSDGGGVSVSVIPSCSSLIDTRRKNRGANGDKLFELTTINLSMMVRYFLCRITHLYLQHFYYD